MSYVVNAGSDFALEAAEGFVAVHSAIVRRVRGGVARRTATPPGQVVVVVGGGSGHYPAFAGLVGTGLAHAAVMGNVFASPSARQAYDVARAVEAGAGVLFVYGNYAGDVLNFDQAQARLRADGLECRTVTVTDDISSAALDDRSRRRGVAGDLAVFKVAAWAAEQGWPLDAVAALTARANDRCRTVGVAFSGATLPGSDEPLFRVPARRMAVGMGIHGEPGIEETTIPTADELAAMLVALLLTESPPDTGSDGRARVAVIVNGLGSVKGEELFVLYRSVKRLLDEAGITVVEPEVGEFATSFEMAGVSLTLLWLDDDLETAWRSAAYAAGYRKGSTQTAPGHVLPDDDSDGSHVSGVPDATDESRTAVPVVLGILAAIQSTINQHVHELGRLDAIAGDGDHGIGMQRGSTAALEAATTAAAEAAGAGTVLTTAGIAWADQAGGTSGALWGTALQTAGQTIGDTHRPDSSTVLQAVTAARDAIVTAGGAAVGDKTMIDALEPFVATLTGSLDTGTRLADAWQAAAADATAAAQATSRLLPRLGRARPHQQASLGTPDPGAVSLALAMRAAADALTNPDGGPHD